MPFCSPYEGGALKIYAHFLSADYASQLVSRLCSPIPLRPWHITAVIQGIKFKFLKQQQSTKNNSSISHSIHYSRHCIVAFVQSPASFLTLSLLDSLTPISRNIGAARPPAKWLLKLFTVVIIINKWSAIWWHSREAPTPFCYFWCSNVLDSGIRVSVCGSDGSFSFSFSFSCFCFWFCFCLFIINLNDDPKICSFPELSARRLGSDRPRKCLRRERSVSWHGQMSCIHIPTFPGNYSDGFRNQFAPDINLLPIIICYYIFFLWFLFMARRLTGWVGGMAAWLGGYLPSKNNEQNRFSLFA